MFFHFTLENGVKIVNTTTNLGIEAYRQGLIFKDRKRLSQESIEMEAIAKKKRKTYLKSVANRF